MTCGCLSPPEERQADIPRPTPLVGMPEPDRLCGCKTKAPGSCSCGGKGKSCCHGPPPHPDGSLEPATPDAPVAASAAAWSPPVMVPRCSVIRCGPPHEELRPAWSFMACAEYAELLSGSAAPQPLMAEPPQALESTSADRATQEWRDADRALRQDGPTPEAVAPTDAAAQCTPRASVMARFSTMPLCRNQALDLPASDGSGLFSPVSPEARGKGGGGAVPCECKCSCPTKLVAGGAFLRPPSSALDLGVPFWLQPLTPPPIRLPLGGGLGPIRVLGPGDAPGGGPIPDPFPYPLSHGGVSATSIGFSSSAAGRGGTTPGKLGSTVQREDLIVSPDAPAEQIFEGECPWCGGVRRTSKVDDSPLADAERSTGLEPPQFVRVASIPPGPGSLSLGSPAAPPMHSAIVPDPTVLAPSGSTSRAQRQVHGDSPRATHGG